MEDVSEPDYLAAFIVDATTYFVRWHPDDYDAEDEVVVSASGAWALQSPQDCLLAWPTWTPLDASPVPMDFGPAQQWLSGRRLALPAVSCLNLWNFAGDVGRGVGLPWHDRAAGADRVHARLTFAAVPFLVPIDRRAARWSPAEMRVARRYCAAALSLLRRALREQGA